MFIIIAVAVIFAIFAVIFAIFAAVFAAIFMVHLIDFISLRNHSQTSPLSLLFGWLSDV